MAEGGAMAMVSAKKVLVVDDEKGIRFLLSEVLLNQGFDVSLARDGQESLDKLEKDHFDLVVTDINMPRLDGVAMLERMKTNGRSEKIIIMTGDPSDRRLSDTEIPNVVTRLLKPFEIENFLNVVIAATGGELDATVRGQVCKAAA
jgi:DNA-binding NtrC family response regulator